jgi:class 3 adenylate cyclase/HAMP domain-containing protein
VVTLLLFGFAAVAIFINIDETEKELERRLDYSLNLSTKSLPVALWNLDNDVVEDFVSALFLDPTIAHVQVRWTNQVISERTRESFEAADIPNSGRSSKLIVKTSEIEFEEHKVGAIRIAVSRESVRDELVLNITGIIALTVLIIFGIWLTSVAITRRYISGPLLQLQASATSIAHGNLETAIEIDGRDEIGSLARNLNTMRESIRDLFAETRESHEKLEEYGRTLEQRVEERTAELAQATNAAQEARGAAEEASKLVSEKNQTLETLSAQLAKYLSPQIYDSIFSGEQNVEIASKRKKLTIFFSDIAEFTETTDNLESEELTDVLNHYLTEMSTIALEYGATIDKYIGDAILLFFGDPESKGVKEDARACVLMAVAMQRRMRELENEWRNRGLERPFRIRMGICTGYCTVGNFGSRDRMDYTIVGNEVNLAARLETAAEPGSILLAHETNALVRDIVLTEEQPAIRVKGFARPIENFKVVETYDELIDEGRVIHRDGDGVTITVDRDRLDKAGKESAIQELEDVIAQLRK